MATTVSELLADFVLDLRYEKIPVEVVEKTKDLILDTVGICVSSARIEFGRSILALAERWGGMPESSLVGIPAKVAAHHAAFANGVLGHGQDYDDTHTESMVHASASLVPAALALSEATSASGQETLTALIAALEISIRVGMPAMNRFHLRGFHTTSICCTFGAALMAARMLRYDMARTLDAVGVAGSFASGLLECVPAASGSKSLHAGWAASCGILAAQLAGAGFSGPRSVFEGKLGVYNSFLRGESVDLDAIVSELGTQWEVLNIRPKLYPCCHYLQTFIDCARRARESSGFKLDEIEHIECRIAEGAVNIVCDPWITKIAPKSVYDARFSLPFAIAITLITGNAGVAEFSERYLQNPEVLVLMKRISYAVDPTFSVHDMPAALAIAFRGGRHFDRVIPRVRGDAANAIPRDELMNKFRANTGHLGPRFSGKIAEAILHMECHSDITALIRGLRETPHEDKG